MYALFFVVILLVGGLIGLVRERSLEHREQAYAEALARHPVAAQIIEDLAEEHRFGLEDLARAAPGADPREVDVGLSRLETRGVLPPEVQTVIGEESRTDE